MAEPLVMLAAQTNKQTTKCTNKSKRQTTNNNYNKQSCKIRDIYFFVITYFLQKETESQLGEDRRSLSHGISSSSAPDVSSV